MSHRSHTPGHSAISGNQAAPQPSHAATQEAFR
jgi:hypothetical protein